MILLKLSSDNENFKTIKFNTGLSIVAGLQKSKDNKKSYNGVGKSSGLNLIHWILGAKINNKTARDKKVNDFLKSYGNFYLKVRHKGCDFLIMKNFSHSEFYVNDKKYSAKDYATFLTETFIDNSFSSLSFRSVINCFARRYGEKYYSEAYGQQGQPNSDYKQRFINLALLGIDTSIVNRKHLVKKNIDKLTKSKSAIDSLISQDDIHLLKDLKEELRELKILREELEIAVAYDNEKEIADKLTFNINLMRDKLYEYRKSLQRKNTLLSQIGDVDVDIEQLKSVYEEANLLFSNDVNVGLKDACDFHRKLISNRTNRLAKDIGDLSDEIVKVKNDLEPAEKKRDILLKNLSAKGAFDEYDAVSSQILLKSDEVSKIESNLRFSKSIEAELSKEKLTNAAIHNEALGYLNSITESLEEIDDKFRRIVRSFYGSNTGSVNLTLSKDAQYLYDLDIHIPKDSSQGVNEVRIFCYDMLLYEMNKSILGFMAHDGCIFSELDPRHKARMFKVVLEYINDFGLQYFINIGQSSLDEVLSSDVLTISEKEEIRQSIALELLDESPETWLFGTQFG
ncbi:DUF2326 domain-containing protein [Enterovibrio norvegicus]|uniref:DUF2326 domain-containing protein n=1 Tax=Enterovibrio norvegicus TaxID=188144 RepID=UPI00352D1311